MLRLLNAGRQVMPPVTKYTNLKIERVLDFDDRTLSFSIPINAMPTDMILENYIQTENDEYVIKQISINGNYYDIIAQLNIDELEGTHWETFTTKEQTIQQTTNLALAGTGWTCTCDIKKKRSIKKTNIYTWDILKQIVKTYRVEMLIDSLNKNITFVEKRGEDKGVYFSSQLNLKSVGKQAQTTDFYTIIVPIGKDGLTIESVNNGKKYLENYTYSSKKKTYYWKDQRYTVAQNLKEDAEAKLADMATPRVSYSCDIIDLAIAKKNDYSFFRYDLGDTVTIVDSYTNIRVTQRIVKMTEYPERPEQNQCEISNVKLSFEELAQKYEDTADTVDNITTDNGTVDGDAIDSIPASKILQLDEVIANSAKFKQVDTDIINVRDTLTATTARIGTLETTALTAATADIKYAKINDLTAVTAKINTLEANALTANSAEIKSLKAGVADINTLMFGTASGGSLTTEFSNSVVGLIGDAQIKSAMIKDISADKILSGKLYTNLVQICSQSGNLDIADNTIQIRDSKKTPRVQIGKDGTGDYNIYIWDKNGKLMFDPLYGIQADGIKKAIIRNDMISDNANISGEKIDIASLITNINADGSHTLNASKIYVDTDKQTLDVSFKKLTTNVSTVTTSVTTAINTANTANTTANNATTTANSAKSTATTANTTAITAKNTADAAKQTATTANGNANSALSKANTLEANLKTVTEKVTTQGTQLTAIQGNISSKIWQQDITTAVTNLEVGGRNLYTGSKDFSGYWGQYSSLWYSSAEYNNLPVKYKSTPWNGLYQLLSAVKGEYYTISAYVKVTQNTNLYISQRADNHSGISAKLEGSGVPFVQITAGSWKRVYKTVKVLEAGNIGLSVEQQVGGMYICGVKLEKGTKSTDWTPAIEDVDSSIKTLEGSTTTLSNQYTSLNQTLTSLSATVNSNTTAITKKADGSSVTSLQNKVTAIQADLNGYKTTVEKTYVTETKFNDLEIGGRNLAEGTNNGTSGWSWSMQTGGATITEVVENGIKTCKMVRNNVAQSGWSVISYNNIGRTKWQPNTKYTVSLEVKASVNTYLHPEFRQGDWTDTLIAKRTAVNNITKAGHWVKLVWIVETLATLPTTTRQETYFTGMNSGVGVSYQFRNLKIEKGTKATDWTSAPEDADSKITVLQNTTKTLSTQYTTVDQSLTSLKATVNSNTSKINTKADGSTVTSLQSNVTNLTATVNSLSATVSSNTTKINTKADGSTVTSLQTKVTSIQTDLSGYKSTVANTYATKNTLNNYATTAAVNSAIDQKANSITQSVSATINNLQIGGRNLLIGSSIWTKDNPAKSKSTSDGYVYLDKNINAYLENNKTYTIQACTDCYWSGHGGSTNTGGATIWITNGSYHRAFGDNINSRLTGRHSWTFKHDGATGYYYIRVNGYNKVASFWNIKIETGSKATDWTPATEDMATKANLELKIDKSDNGKIISMINAAADEINLKSNRLSWSSTGTSMTKEGNFTCTTGKIGGFNITSTGINSTTNTVGINVKNGWAFYAGDIIAGTDRHVFSIGHEGNVYSAGSAYFNGSAHFNGTTYANSEFYVTTSRYGQCAVALTEPTQSIKMVYDVAHKNLIFVMNGKEIANVYGA